MASEGGSSGGVGFGGLLAILFIGLKLGGVIDWSWWWVLSPLWIPVVVLIGIGLVILIVAAFVSIIDDHRPRRSRWR